MPASPIASNFGPFPRHPPLALLFVAIVGFADLSSPTRCFAQETTSSIPVGIFPYGIAVNEVTDKIYVNNVGGNSVSVVDGSTGSVAIAANVPSPDGITVNSQTNEIYVISGS